MQGGAQGHYRPAQPDIVRHDARNKGNILPTALEGRRRRAYASQKTGDVVNAVKERVAENPLQSLAVGAAVAYPLLGIIKKVPVPLALIAAGLFISKGRSPSARRKSDFSAKWPAGAGRENGGLDESVDAAADSEPADRAQATAGIASEAGARAASAGASIANAASDTRDTVVDLVDRNPLLVGGLAMAVGGFIAASLPASRMENDLIKTDEQCREG